MQIPEALIVSHIIFWIAALWIARDLRKTRRSVEAVAQSAQILRRKQSLEGTTP
jgi:hypothetical protein